MLCKPIILSQKEAQNLKIAVRFQYHHNWLADHLPAAYVVSDQYVRNSHFILVYFFVMTWETTDFEILVPPLQSLVTFLPHNNYQGGSNESEPRQIEYWGGFPLGTCDHDSDHSWYVYLL